MDLEQRIRQRAYDLWERAGRPNDQSDAFWLRARAEIEGDALPIGDRPTGAPDLLAEEQASTAEPQSARAKSARRPASTDAGANGPRKSSRRRR
jgi:hypothetical protein